MPEHIAKNNVKDSNCKMCLKIVGTFPYIEFSQIGPVKFNEVHGHIIIKWVMQCPLSWKKMVSE